MSKSDVLKMALLVAYVLGFFLTWTYLIAYSWVKGGGEGLYASVILGWVLGALWPILVASLAWLHYWFV